MNRMSLLLGASLLLAATGCSDSIEPGDYVVYRIATASAKMGDNCGLTANEMQDSSSLRESATVILFAGHEGEFYLDMGTNTLEGEYSGESTEGDEYAFDGTQVDVEWSDPSGVGTKWTTTTKMSVDLVIEDELVTGVSRNRVTYACSGEMCGAAQPECTSTTEFVGTEVEDVELRHDVN